jgi:alpha-beta hydrolase superfamily lysophospholipase
MGYALYALDHIGHGQSEGDRVFVDRFDDFTTTLKTFFDLLKKWQPEKPVFLVGHSMGGLIIAAYLLEHQDELAGAVLSGPCVKIPDNISGSTIMLGKLLSVLMPKAGLIQVDASGLSKDPTVVDAYVNDPLVFTGKTTARLAAEMLKIMQRVTDHAASIHLPIMIVQGSEDKLVDPGGAPMLHNAVSSEDKTLKVYDGMYHEVFNEPERDQVLSDVQDWLDAHL